MSPVTADLRGPGDGFAGFGWAEIGWRGGSSGLLATHSILGGLSGQPGRAVPPGLSMSARGKGLPGVV